VPVLRALVAELTGLPIQVNIVLDAKKTVDSLLCAMLPKASKGTISMRARKLNSRIEVERLAATAKAMFLPLSKKLCLPFLQSIVHYTTNERPTM
jgi:hypothetical protein